MSAEHLMRTYLTWIVYALVTITVAALLLPRAVHGPAAIALLLFFLGKDAVDEARLWEGKLPCSMETSSTTRTTLSS